MTTTYKIWYDMINRCTNINCQQYPRYGAIGITVDPLWLDYSVFLNDMGERPGKLTLDRINGKLGYSKTNSRWADRSTQNYNYNKTPKDSSGKAYSQIAKENGISAAAFNMRINKYGMTPKEASTRPLLNNRGKRS